MFPMREGMENLGPKGIDLAALAMIAEALAVSFEGFKYEWFWNAETGMAELQWWIPLMPFIRFKMPWTLDNLKSFAENIQSVITAMENENLPTS